MNKEQAAPPDSWKVVFGKETDMSSVNNFCKLITLRNGICILVAIIVNCISPYVLNVYECRFHGRPVMSLTEFALHKFPYVALLLCSGMLVETIFVYDCGSTLHGFCEKLLTYLFVVGFILYLMGVMLPFIRCHIGLEG